jgi:acetyltransferase
VPQGNKVAIVTNAGGPGIVATDMTISSGLDLARFKDETIKSLASHLPSTANLNNPVDIIGDAAQDRYEDALSAVINDEGVDGALVILTPQSMTNALGTAEAIVRIAKRSYKPVICCFMGIIDVSEGVQYLQEEGIPVFKFPEDAAKAFGILFRYSKWLSREHLDIFHFNHDKAQAAEILSNCISLGKTRLGEIEGSQILKCYGFNVLPAHLATNEHQAADIAEAIGFPVVMKIVSEQILHKSDANGVKLNLNSREDVKRAYQDIVAAAGIYNSTAVIEGVIVQKMAPFGHEVILGVNRYPIFGPLLMFGIGGILVELFKDVEFRLAPIQRNEAHRMIRAIKSFKLLEGFRGKPKADLIELEKSLVRISDLAINHPEIIEMDINPLLVHQDGNGATVADCRIILDKR